MKIDVTEKLGILKKQSFKSKNVIDVEIKQYSCMFMCVKTNSYVHCTMYLKSSLFVHFFVCPIITHEPLDGFASNFVPVTRKTLRNSFSRESWVS